MFNLVSVLVANQPGVLVRVASLFSRRNFNIHSLAVGITSDPATSRITLVINSNRELNQIFYQLNKLPVVKAVQLLNSSNVARSLALFKINANDSNRIDILKIAETFRAHVVDVNPNSLILELTGSLDKLNAFSNILKPFGIIEFIQTGLIALERGNLSINDALAPNPFFAKNLL